MQQNDKPTARLLVIADRYPPDVWGGAELSLHEVMRLLPEHGWNCRVLALTSEPNSHLQQDLIDGVHVTRIALDAGYVGLGKFRRAFRKLLQQSADSRGAARRFFLCAATAGGNDALGYRRRSRDSIIHSLQLVSLVQRIVNEWKPDVVHADNKDSILLLSRLALPGVRKVALVRDNRFACSHPEQDMLVNEEACVSCGLECIAQATILQRRLLALEMREAARVRGLAIRAMDRVLTTSTFLADQLAPLIGGERPQIIGNPHPDLHQFDDVAADVLTTFPPEILFAGNLRHAKGPQVLAECFAEITRAIPQVRFVFAGCGPLKARIAQIAKESGVSDRVKMTGFLNRIDMFMRLASASVVVAPNLGPEPFGRLPLEAAVACKPIVASATGGYRETVIDGETGLLVPPGDRNALAEAVISLLRDPQRAAEMGKAARAHVTANFAPAEIARRLSSSWRAELRK